MKLLLRIRAVMSALSLVWLTGIVACSAGGGDAAAPSPSRSASTGADDSATTGAEIATNPEAPADNAASTTDVASSGDAATTTQTDEPQVTTVTATIPGSVPEQTTEGGANSFDLDTSGDTDSTTADNACAVASATATLTREPVDIILVLDNSGTWPTSSKPSRTTSYLQRA